MLRAAAQDPDPCILFEARALYQTPGTVTLGGAIESACGAKMRREGKDLVIISWGATVHDALSAARSLSERGHDVGVLDLRWLSPLDDDAIAAAVVSCGRVLVVHEANQTMGFGAEVVTRIAERLSTHLKSPVRRLGTPDTRIPASPVLQTALLPRAPAIVTAALSMLEPAVNTRRTQ